MYHCAWLAEQGLDSVREVSGLKAWACEMINHTMYDCVQFHGGMGYMRETAVERMSRDARILPIGGGATEVLLEEVAKRLSLRVALMTALPPRLRSLLFAPAVRPDLVAKMPATRADLIAIDLEDATPVGAKPDARAALGDLVESVIGQVPVSVRVNDATTQWFADDVAALPDGLAAVVVVPEDRDNRRPRPHRLDPCRSRPRRPSGGRRNRNRAWNRRRSGAARPSGGGCGLFRAEDFIVDMGGARTSSNHEVAYARGAIALAARLAEVPVLDQVVADFRDDERFRRECGEAGAMGFAGKLCIHPAQVALAADAFTPTPEEVERATRLLAAFDAASAGGVAQSISRARWWTSRWPPRPAVFSNSPTDARL